MIKLAHLINENVNIDDINKKYPLAGDVVDGRHVRKNIDNTSSIEASLYEYKILRGLRIVPMSDFNVTGKHYSVAGNARIEISPLIVVVDKEGPYILEGATRIDALKLIGAISFPALVVIDLE